MAEYPMTGTLVLFLNDDDLNIFFNPARVLAIFFHRVFSGSISILFKTTSRSSRKISPNAMHSAVCTWSPLVTSTTSIIRSIVDAPAMTDLIKAECPGQSTSVN